MSGSLSHSRSSSSVSSEYVDLPEPELSVSSHGSDLDVAMPGRISQSGSESSHDMENDIREENPSSDKQKEDELPAITGGDVWSLVRDDPNSLSYIEGNQASSSNRDKASKRSHSLDIGPQVAKEKYRRGVSLDLRRRPEGFERFVEGNEPVPKQRFHPRSRKSMDRVGRVARASMDRPGPVAAADASAGGNRMQRNRRVFQQVFDEMLQYFRTAYFDFRFKNSARWDIFEISQQIVSKMTKSGSIGVQESREAMASLSRENKDRHFLYLGNQLAIPVIEVLSLQSQAQLALVRFTQTVNLAARDRLPARFCIVLLTPNAMYSSWVKKSITFLVHVMTTSHENDEAIDLHQLLWGERAGKVNKASVLEGLARFREKELERLNREDQSQFLDVGGGGGFNSGSRAGGLRPSMDWARHRISLAMGRNTSLDIDEDGVDVEGGESQRRPSRTSFRAGRFLSSAFGGGRRQGRASSSIELPQIVEEKAHSEEEDEKVKEEKEDEKERGRKRHGKGVTFPDEERMEMSSQSWINSSEKTRRRSSAERNDKDDGSESGSDSDSQSRSRSSYDDDDDNYSSDSSVHSFFDEDTGIMHLHSEQNEITLERRARAKRIIPPGLEYVKWPMGGLWYDFKRRIPHYLHDWREGFHVKCVAAIIFLFFSCLTPAVAFGSLMDIETNSQIGVMEMVLATGMVGVIFAVFGGQPLIIQAGTGPLLVFTKYLYQITDMVGIDFLPAYAWIGMWTGVMLIVISIFDFNFLIRYLTPFTDEIFAALISLIFIYEAVYDLIHGFMVAEDHNAEVPLLGVILGLGTFYIAIVLRDFRYGKFLRPRVRAFLSDFGSPIAVLAMTIVSIVLDHVDVEKLNVPTKFSTTSGRSWIVSLLDIPVWWPFAAILPAMLAAILCYLDENITARIVNRPQNRLKKGPAYNIDLFVVGALIIICSMMGLPWLVAATVQSMNHLTAVSLVEQKENEFGKVEPHIVRVFENRLTGVAIHVLVGVSVFASPLLRKIPLGALFGLFIFMGVVSLQGNLLWERIKLLFTQPSLFPPSHYVRNVRFPKIVLFTLIQLTCLIILWVVKTSPIAITFPLFIVALVPVRFILGKLPFFSREDLLYLDSDEVPEHEKID